LHQGVVQALVEKGTLYIRDYDPRVPLGGDVFIHDGHVYANKQPGSFLLGAAVYWVLRSAGIDYDRNFYLTAALVGVLTSGLLTATTAVLVYRLARRRAPEGWAVGAALAFGLGSSAFPYAGALHHDVMATSCLVGAYAVRRRALLAGALLGLAITSSLLPAAMVVMMAALFAIDSAPRAAEVGEAREASQVLLARRAGAIALGIVVGAAPLLLCNWLALGAPWRMPFITGGMWPESSPRFDPQRAIGLLAMYAKLLVWYAPIVVMGWVGLAWGAIERRPGGGTPAASTATNANAAAPASDTARENRVLLAIVAAQLLFVISLGTDGACQYGPRLLLPTMPFACLGLTVFAARGAPGPLGGAGVASPPVSRSRAVIGALIAIGIASFVINLVGALYGTMFCDVTQHAFLEYADAIRHRHFFSFPLLGIEGQAPY
jgi:hypothetical protein